MRFYSSLMLIWTALVLILFATAKQPVSFCLGNCADCPLNAPTQCVAATNSNGQTYNCIPYYEGSDCESSTSSKFTLYAQSGPFFNWSLPNPLPATDCQLQAPASGTVPSIGFFDSQLNASKSLRFSADQKVTRLEIKLGVAVSDAQLANAASSTNTTTTNRTDAQGNTIITTIQSTNSNQLPQAVPFLTLDVLDQLNSGALVSRQTAQYSSVSGTRTSCGFVYQYQWTVDATSGVFQQLMLNFYQAAGSNVVWNLIDFRVQAGCSGFTVGNQCSNCLSGYSQSLGPANELYGCRPCPYNCSTCQENRCLLCEIYTQSGVNGQCAYPSSYPIYQKFSPTVGATINQTGQFDSLHLSQGRQLQITQPLNSNFGFFAKFYLLYTEAFAQGLTSLTILLNGLPHETLNSIEIEAGTLHLANNGQSQLYAKQITMDYMSQTNFTEFTLTVSAVSSVGEFYVANLVVIQYACIENCAVCQFNPQQTTACTKCQPFYVLSQSCHTCANGFFESGSSCVKCYSNCLQCNGERMTDCTSCFNNFQLQDIKYTTACAQCLYSNSNQTSLCAQVCPADIAGISSNTNCTSCFAGSRAQLYSSAQCTQCWKAIGIRSGQCNPITSSGSVFFASDLPLGSGDTTSWTGSPTASSYDCGSNYTNIYGIPPNPNATNPSTLTYELVDLPGHSGLTFVFDIFKIDQWGDSLNDSLTLRVVASSPGSQSTSFDIPLTNEYGGNVCGGPGNQMIWTVQARLRDHTAGSIKFTVSAPDDGLMVREVEIYLGNCPDCKSVALSYDLFWIPMYSDNSTQTGLDVWVTFNNKLSFNTPNNNTQSQSVDLFASSFSFSYAGNRIMNPVLLQNELLEERQDYLKYFLPYNGSEINKTLTANTSSPQLVFSTQDGVTRQLTAATSSTQVNRYVDASMDERKSIEQLWQFYRFFTWLSLITMIVCVMLGVGVVFEQFSQLMGVFYLHIYITSALLPPTIKVPLTGAVRMEHLNYFADISQIQNDLFGGMRYPAQFIFQQFNIDVYFLRSFYPILIINAIFVGWFIILAIINLCVTAFRESPNRFLRFLRSIPQRPLAYFDQIWRYQLIASSWACLIQFTSFESDSGQIFNLVLCVIAFIVIVLWPFFVVLYTNGKHNSMNVNHFRYAYHDIYYLKISSVADDRKYYLYYLIRHSRLFAYAIFIALFVNQEIVGPVILILILLIEMAFVFCLDIFRSQYYLFTRLFQNLILIVAAILCLVIYGFSDRDSMSSGDFDNIGYGVSVVFVIGIINALIRWFYLVYRKIQEWSYGTYDVGQAGEKENYDGKGPIPLAQSQRLV